MSTPFTVCPGCTLILPTAQTTVPPPYNASTECYALYSELAFYTLSLRDDFFIHQLIVDAYAAAHAGLASNPMTIAFALIGLFVVFEKHGSGKDAQNIHKRLAEQKRDWPVLPIPKQKASLTIQDTLKHAPGTARDDAIKAWAKSEWERWKATPTVLPAVRQWIHRAR